MITKILIVKIIDYPYDLLQIIQKIQLLLVFSSKNSLTIEIIKYK